MKSIPQQSKTSTSLMLFKGISCLLEMLPVLWQLSHLLTYSFASLKSEGQKNPACRTLAAVLFPLKWPPYNELWQCQRILLASSWEPYILLHEQSLKRVTFTRFSNKNKIKNEPFAQTKNAKSDLSTKSDLSVESDLSAESDLILHWTRQRECRERE